MVFSYWIWIFSIPLDLTSLLPSLSVSPQRIFNSFVYTEKTSNGETEVQQVSNKGFSFPLRVCVWVCVCLCVHVLRLMSVELKHNTRPQTHSHIQSPSEEKGDLLKFYSCCFIGFEVLCLFSHLSTRCLSLSLSLSLCSHCECRAAGRQNMKAWRREWHLSEIGRFVSYDLKTASQNICEPFWSKARKTMLRISRIRRKVKQDCVKAFCVCVCVCSFAFVHLGSWKTDSKHHTGKQPLARTDRLMFVGVSPGTLFPCVCMCIDLCQCITVKYVAPLT